MTKTNKLIHYEKNSPVLPDSTGVFGGSMKKTVCNCYAS